MGIGAKSEQDDGAADFLRRLSVADAKVLLDRTRKEKEAKTKEMQKMIGVRYRDLIDSADKIVTMHSAAMRLETSLKEMPAKWRQIESKLVGTLSKSSLYSAPDSNERSENKDADSDIMKASIRERVMFIVTSHDKLWFCLDRGECNRALALYQRAKSIFESHDLQEQLPHYPFLTSMWASVCSFEQRVKSSAEVCLASRGQPASFYSNNLDALAAVGCTSSLEDSLEAFLKSRTKWLEFEEAGSEDMSPEEITAARARQMRLNFRSLLLTVSQAQELFSADGGSLVAKSALWARYHKELSNTSARKSIHETIVAWFAIQMQLVSKQAGEIVAKIPTIALIAQTQSSLMKIESQYAAYRHTSLWSGIEASNSPHAPRSMFQSLFGDALRRRTRDLVQHSFMDATSTIKNDLRQCVGSMQEMGSMTRHLPGIKFFECFDAIHKKVSGLDSSELQRVLAEEYIRTLFNIVLFLEEEYPWSSGEKIASGASPGYLLGLANTLVSIVSLFPGRKKALFGDIDTHASTEFDDTEDLRRFQKSATSGRVPKAELQLLLKLSTAEVFLEDDIKSVDSIGYVAYQLLARLGRGEDHSSIFVGIIRNLAEKYCEAWARNLLRQKISPLREFLQMEQYDMTNDEWRLSHQGWSEHTVLDDELSDTDPGDEASLGEKVWLPWCETPSVSSFLFSCCYALDEAYRLVRSSSNVSAAHGQSMHALIRAVLTEQLTILSVDVYEEALDLVAKAKATQDRNVLNFGESCVLQFLFDMYFVRATLGFSDFVRFGWGDEIDLATCSPSLARLKQLFERMHDFVDPVDWEIYGPHLIENVVIQFRKSRLLFSSLSEANDISEINGKAIVVSAQDTRPIIKLTEPVPRFSLLPVPTTRRRSPTHSGSSIATSSQPSSTSGSLFHENPSNSAASLPSLKLQNLLTSTAGTNLLSSAAKGMSFLSSATSSYLGDAKSGEAPRSKYF